MKTLKRLILCGLAAFSFALSSCDNPVVPPTEECINHYDSNSDGKCDNCGTGMPTEKQDFKGLSFKNETFTYDGKEHSIYVKGVPDFATVSYTNNGKTDPGTYTVSATVKATGYITKKLSAKLTIEGLTFEGVTFEDKVFDYDGKVHSLEVSGAPEGTNVSFTNNSKIDVGVYDVTAVLTKRGYNEKTLTAKLTIKGIDFVGVTLESKTFDYDGKAHSLEVSGAPEGSKVSYTNNSKTNVGTYKVTAVVSKAGYNDLKLEATLTINPIDFEGLAFEDKTFEYDGKAHSLEVKNLPTGAKVTYNGNGKTAVGTYTVTATVSKTGYNTKTLTATLEITPAKEPIEVDPNKTAFSLNESTTFDDFREAIYGGNYTVSIEDGSRFLYYSGESDTHEYIRRENSLSSLTVFGADGDKTFKKESQVWCDPITTKATYTKIVGDYAFSKVIDNEYSSEFFEKTPATAFTETFSNYYAIEIFNHLRRTDSNGFEPFLYVDYYEYFTTFEFVDNTFVVDVHSHIDHTDLKRVTEEYTTFTFSNVGNTVVNIPSQHIGSVSEASNYDVGEFIYQGITYHSYSNEVSANITLDYAEVDYLPKGHLTLLPEVYGLPIKDLSMDFYTVKWGEHATDYTGYILDAQFDENFKYSLEYKQYGYINPITIDNWPLGTIVGRFQSFGGEINYHVDVVDIGFFQDRTSGALTDLDKYYISVINGGYYSKKQIETIQETGTKVFGYVDAGRISKSDSHYNEFKDITLKPCEDDPNYYWVDVRETSWQTYVRDTLIQGLFDMGVDGVYLDGVRVYEEYDDYYYNVRQSIGYIMKKVLNNDYVELMMQSCDNLMWHFNWDGVENWPPYYVDYYVQEEVFTKVEDKATNTFVAQSSEVESQLKTDLEAIVETFDLNVVLLEYEVSETIDNKIQSYCEEMGYHCYISNKVILN